MSKMMDRIFASLLSGSKTYNSLSSTSKIRNKAASMRMRDDEETTFNNPKSKRTEDGQIPDYAGDEGAKDDNKPEEHDVDSTAIKSIRYSPEQHIAEVTFQNGSGKTYGYPVIYQDSMDAWLASSSKGKGFWHYIQPHAEPGSVIRIGETYE